MTYYTYILKNMKIFQKNIIIRNKSCIDCILNKYLDNNNNNQRSFCLTKLNLKLLSKSIKSPTISNIGNTKALYKRHKNIISRLYRNFKTLPYITCKTQHFFHLLFIYNLSINKR